MIQNEGTAAGSTVEPGAGVRGGFEPWTGRTQDADGSLIVFLLVRQIGAIGLGIPGTSDRTRICSRAINGALDCELRVAAYIDQMRRVDTAINWHRK